MFWFSSLHHPQEMSSSCWHIKDSEWQVWLVNVSPTAIIMEASPLKYWKKVGKLSANIDKRDMIKKIKKCEYFGYESNGKAKI